MAVRSKTEQLREMGWNLSPVPYLVPEGMLIFEDGRKSAAYWTTKYAREWFVRPPEGHPVGPRKVEGRYTAIRWAWAQATAPRLDASLAGVASLAALASAAATSGKVMEGEDEAGLAPVRPDAELIGLCREVMACERSAEATREGKLDRWGDPEGYRRRADHLHDVVREKERLVPLIFEQEATTHEGLCAMAEVLRTLYKNTKGVRAAAVRSLVDDLLKVLRRQSAPA